MGKGVLQAVNNVNTILRENLIGYDVFKQTEIDRKMIELDGTETKSNLGANAILGVSMAVMKAAALSVGYHYIVMLVMVLVYQFQ